MGTHYDELGVPPTASSAEIRRAYRARARLLHPDTSGSADSAAMGRLNAAYAVLSDAGARRRYDRSLALETSADGLAPAGPVTTDHHRSPHRVRLARQGTWVALLAVLLALFVLSAYAGRDGEGPEDRHSSDVRPGSSSAVGRCLERQPALDAFVTCPASGGEQIVADITDGGACPPGSAVRQVRGRDQTLCTRTRSSG